MSTPTQKHTKSRKNIRRKSKRVKSLSLVICPKCKHLMRPHRACSNCGYYKGKESIKIRVPKKFRKKKEVKKEAKK